MSAEKSILDDYLARLNIEGSREVWKNNHIKLDFIYKKIEKYIYPSLSVCDIGIGDGHMLTRFYASGLKVTGIDVAEYSIDYLSNKFCKSGMDIELIHSDIAGAELKENQFDMVTCFDIIEHIHPNELEASIEKIKRSLKNDGLLIGTLPLGEDLDEGKVICPKCSHEFHRCGHFHSFATVGEIRNMLGGEFRIIKTGEVPFTWFGSNYINRVISFTVKYVKRMARRKFDTTLYFVARLNKS